MFNAVFPLSLAQAPMDRIGELVAILGVLQCPHGQLRCIDRRFREEDLSL